MLGKRRAPGPPSLEWTSKSASRYGRGRTGRCWPVPPGSQERVSESQIDDAVGRKALEGGPRERVPLVPIRNRGRPRDRPVAVGVPPAAGRSTPRASRRPARMRPARRRPGRSRPARPRASREPRSPRRRPRRRRSGRRPRRRSRNRRPSSEKGTFAYACVSGKVPGSGGRKSSTASRGGRSSAGKYESSPGWASRARGRRRRGRRARARAARRREPGSSGWRSELRRG